MKRPIALHDQSNVYVLEPDLDDSVEWRAERSWCSDCAWTTTIVWRVDRDAFCPKCSRYRDDVEIVDCSGIIA